MKYAYLVMGAAADGQTWSVSGVIDNVVPGEFLDKAAMAATRVAFMQLTEGKAVYGKPGQGCNGPYRITRLMIEEKLDA